MQALSTWPANTLLVKNEQWWVLTTSHLTFLFFAP